MYARTSPLGVNKTLANHLAPYITIPFIVSNPVIGPGLMTNCGLIEEFLLFNKGSFCNRRARL